MRRFLISVLVLVVILALSSGCGSGSGASAKKVVKLLHQFTDDPNANALAVESYGWVVAAKQKFEAENPGYEVQLEYVGNSSINAKIMSDFAAGIDHDVFMSQSSDMAQHAVLGSVYDQTAFFNALPQDEQTDFSWHPCWTGNFKINGKVIGLPLGLHTRTIAYRKDLFVKADLDPDRPPKDWDELIQYAQKLTRDGVWGLDIYMGSHQGALVSILMPFIWSRGGDFFDEKTKTATFTNPAVLDTIQFYYDIIYKYKVTPEWVLEGDQEQGILNPFINGQVAMSAGLGNYWLNSLQRGGLMSGVYPASANPDDSKVGWFLMPADKGVTYINAWGLSVYGLTKQPEKAWELLMDAADKEVVKKFISFGGFPGRLSGYDDAGYQSPFWENWLALSRVGRGAPITENFNSLEATFLPAVQQIIASGDITNMQKIMQQAQDEYNTRYAGK
jgi:ABC-type glycerol-3-phosphate transport system substrate-binding protein